MTEEFLHYVWHYKLYNAIHLKTQCGSLVEVVHPGEPNLHAGPDFFNAKIKIGNTLWAGNVEVHINASDWKVHNHQVDKAYDNVILHVVENDNAKVTRTNGEYIPVLIMNYSNQLYTDYLHMKDSKQWLACSDKLNDINSFEISLWMQRMLIERLETKMKEVSATLLLTANNLDETFYRLLFRSFGFGVNGDPFEMLAKSIPLKILLKYCDSLKLIEALLYGQAGFLNQLDENEYYQNLCRDYVFLKQKHQLKGLENHLWKFLRLRPSNFPTIRIAQLSALLVKLKGVFGMIINEPNIKVIEQTLEVNISEFWETHYTFKNKSNKRNKNLGVNSKNLIIINTIVPYLFSFGKITGDDKFVKRALNWLSILKAEKNSVLNKWKDHQILVKNAGDSQALIYLSNNYCKPKKCLQCRIGHKVLVIRNKV